MMTRGMPERRRRGTSLAMQVTVAGVGFGLLVAVVFDLLVHAVREQRDATRRSTAATDVVAPAVLDVAATGMGIAPVCLPLRRPAPGVLRPAARPALVPLAPPASGGAR
jgi:hypothetical protein